MKKLLQLVFGDARNVVSVALAVALALLAARFAPALAGCLLVVALLGAAYWQASR
ncbi:hypothetical protein GALL_427590 [mine drainage metagenome]|jgi:hypothetical protein|uniref:Uncharacterized protein n=1 Tax=mine drainage metagenome TaxID=410659 RepID=A0A1J5QHV6_9ZZZZ